MKYKERIESQFQPLLWRVHDAVWYAGMSIMVTSTLINPKFWNSPTPLFNEVLRPCVRACASALPGRKRRGEPGAPALAGVAALSLQSLIAAGDEASRQENRRAGGAC